MNYKILFSKRAKERLLIHLKKGKYFSLSYMFYSLVWEITLHINRLKKIAVWTENKKEKYIDNYLYNNYGEIIRQYRTGNYNNLKTTSQYPIFIYWDQGLASIPPQVLSSINNITQLNQNVIVLDKNTIKQFIDLPEHVEKRRMEKIVGLAHYADIVRVSLLAKYGGIWIDATSWCTRQIPENVKSVPFYTRKGNYSSLTPLFSKGQWTSWCLGTNQIGYPLFCFIRDMFYEYCKREHCWIDYLLLDKLISIGIKEIPIVNEHFKNLFIDNNHAFALWPLMGKPFNSHTLKAMNKDTWLFKCSYKKTFPEYINESPTFYKKWIDGELNK